MGQGYGLHHVNFFILRVWCCADITICIATHLIEQSHEVQFYLVFLNYWCHSHICCQFWSFTESTLYNKTRISNREYLTNCLVYYRVLTAYSLILKWVELLYNKQTAIRFKEARDLGLVMLRPLWVPNLPSPPTPNTPGGVRCIEMCNMYSCKKGSQ